MLSYEEFKQEIQDDIKLYLPEKFADATVTVQTVMKNNDTALDGLMIRGEGDTVVPNIYLNDLYERYENGADLSDIKQDIADIRVKHDQLDLPIDVSDLGDLDKVRDRIDCKLVNLENNQEYLSGKPHEELEDLAVVYSVNLSNSIDLMSAVVSDNMMERWGITQNELHDIAMENLSKQDLELINMRDMMMEMMGVDKDDPMAALMFPPDEVGMYVLTNHERVNGAKAILDQGTMDGIAEKLGGDFIVLPSSIHECIVLPNAAEMDARTLSNMVQDVNRTQVDPKEVLSDHVYCYDAKAHELIRAEKYVDRQNDRSNERHENKSMKDKLAEKKAEAAKAAPAKPHLGKTAAHDL